MIPIRVQTIHDEHPDLSRRELHRVARAAHLAMGELWANKLLPEHFEPGARQKFGYAPRTEAWLRRKERMRGRMVGGRTVIGGRHDDLLFTGRLRDDVTRSAKNLIHAYPTRVTIRMIGPPYFTLRPRGKRTAQLAREVLAVGPRHYRLLGEAADRGFNAALRQLRASRRLRKVTVTT